VRFTAPQEGEVITSDELVYPIGLKSQTWTPWDNTVAWERCTVSTQERVEIVSLNNGGKTAYYQLSSAPFPINDFDDFAEWRGFNGNQFNMGKAMWTFNVGRHEGTTYERELNKVIHYAQRELLRLGRA
jgi:hypothetical protein